MVYEDMRVLLKHVLLDIIFVYDQVLLG